ncbi:hypothetical protein NUW54_g47 [Trametes sanguinea]|uniref:Uncharacterized protein n=1 Tax=Trametes sanguinea TaxID=158606 RepID=A0ACC1QBQ8_9APHY|nr:hypothetical protein NUW54_g47 [Trametes sanguinea]
MSSFSLHAYTPKTANTPLLAAFLLPPWLAAILYPHLRHPQHATEIHLDLEWTHTPAAGRDLPAHRAGLMGEAARGSHLLDNSGVSSATKDQYCIPIADLKAARANSKGSPDSPLKLLHSVSQLIMCMHGPYLATSQAIALGITICAAPDLDEACKHSVALRECPKEKCAEYVKVTQWLLVQVLLTITTMPGAWLSTLKDYLHNWVSDVQLHCEGQEQLLIHQPTCGWTIQQQAGELGLEQPLVHPSACLVIRVYLIKLHHGHVKMNHKGLPSFLYAEHDGPLEHHPKYLFQGTLLMQAYRYIWMSPNSASKEPSMGGSGHGSISRVNSINSIGPANIVYVMCLLHHVLLSEATWKEQDPKVFNGARFFKKIIKFFSVDSCAKPVLAYYQSCVYGEVDSEDEDDKGKDEFKAAIQTLGKQHETSPSP